MRCHALQPKEVLRARSQDSLLRDKTAAVELSLDGVAVYSTIVTLLLMKVANLLLLFVERPCLRCH